MKGIRPDGSPAEIGCASFADAPSVVKAAQLTPRQYSILVLHYQHSKNLNWLSHALGIDWHTAKAERDRAVASLEAAFSHVRNQPIPNISYP